MKTLMRTALLGLMLSFGLLAPSAWAFSFPNPFKPDEVFKQAVELKKDQVGVARDAKGQQLSDLKSLRDHQADAAKNLATKKADVFVNVKERQLDDVVRGGKQKVSMAKSVKEQQLAGPGVVLADMGKCSDGSSVPRSLSNSFKCPSGSTLVPSQPIMLDGRKTIMPVPRFSADQSGRKTILPTPTNRAVMR